MAGTAAGEASTPATGVRVVSPSDPRRFPKSATRPRPGLVLLGTAFLLVASHPVVWGWSQPGLWFPPAGIALAALIWLDWPVLPVLLVSLGLVEVFAAAHASLLVALTETTLATLELGVGWWLYIHAARGRRRLNDPRSAILFLLLVPILTLGLSSVLRCLVQGPTLSWPFLLSNWSQRAVGVLALTPVLLVHATNWLTGLGWIPVDPVEGLEEKPLPGGGPGEGQRRWGDFAELAGLALSSMLLGSWLAYSHLTEGQVNWHLWGILILLVVWSSLRQSLPGGSLSASVAALCVLFLVGPGSQPALHLALQGNLLALCSVALLVGASIGWLRASEYRYRQVVAHIPAVLYSARFHTPGGLSAHRKGNVHPPARITLVSPACAALFGCEEEELLGEHERWLERIHPQDRELVLAALAQLCRQHVPVVCEYRLNPDFLPAAASDATGAVPANAGGQLSEGKERWVRDTLAPYYSPEGLLLGWEGVVQEITEQRQLASTLRRTSNMLHALIANLPAGVFFVQGPMGQPVLVNARARQLLGQREDHSAGIVHLPHVYRLHKPDGSLYPWEELPVYKALHRGLTTMRDDIVVHRADGRRIPLVTWAAPIDLGTGGAPEAAVWVFEDLTTLRQAEAARLDSEARLRATFETMAEGVIVQDQSGAIIECNPAAGTILGTSVEKLLGQPFPHASGPGPGTGCLREDGSPLPREEQPDQITLRTGQPVRNVILGIPLVPSSESESPEPEGETRSSDFRPSTFDSPKVRWILVNTMPLLTTSGPAGHQPRVVTTFADITAYRHALRVLQLSEEKYRGLVESLPAVVVQLDREQRIIFANSMAKEWLQVRPGDLAGPEWWEKHLHAADLPQFLEGQKAVARGETVRAEVRFIYPFLAPEEAGKAGQDRFGYTVQAPLWHRGEVVGSILIILDTTVQRRMEEALGRAQRLELVGKVASGVVHDFNNLLTAILNLSYLVERNLPQDHATLHHLRTLQNAAQEAVQLAGQLLTLGRQRRSRLRPLVLDILVERTLDLLRSSFPENIQVETYLNVPQGLVLADEGEVQQILMNLCLNARDAMPHGGRLLVETATVATLPSEVLEQRHSGTSPLDQGKEDRSGPWLRLSVSDTGHGMPPEVRAQIFNAFYTTKERGTGLGLAVVRQLVDGFGGIITVASKVQEGTRFDIWLPIHQEVMEN